MRSRSSAACFGVAVCALLVYAVVARAPRVRAGQPPVPRTLDLSAPLTYFIAPGTPASGFRTGDDELARWALSAWLRTAGGSATLRPAAERDAVVRLYWAGPREGQYGETEYLAVDGKRVARVFVRPDLAALGSDIAERGRSDDLFRDTIVYLTCVHELGHAFGLEHTRDFRDIMYAFGYGGDIVEYFMRYRRQLKTRADIAAHSGLSDADAARAKALYAH
jgi:hypothetical protein